MYFFSVRLRFIRHSDNGAV